jgi:hypothetical protein
MKTKKFSEVYEAMPDGTQLTSTEADQSLMGRFHGSATIVRHRPMLEIEYLVERSDGSRVWTKAIG